MGKVMAKVQLDIMCDRFISLDTDLTVEQAESMSQEEVYEMFMEKYRDKALKMYAEIMKDKSFEYELDFYYEE
jgi:hypothetical protein|tara:strand:+ start:105 stop:323 length:219 start_codon:yes stop_codon:yes gene_type:complete